MTESGGEYEAAHLIGMEIIWGEGFMSPGGVEEVASVIDGIAVRGKKILDLGCGLGGPAMALVANHRAGRVVGVDVHRQQLARASELARNRGIADKTEFRLIEPGPLPFEDSSFDVVFTLGVIIKIAQKRELFAEVRRVLRPGGVLVGNDWLRGWSGPLSEEMAEHAANSGLAHHWATPDEIRDALSAAGFEGAVLKDRGGWMVEQLGRDLAALETGPIRERIEQAFGESADGMRDTWRRLLRLAESGELVTAQFRASRPA